MGKYELLYIVHPDMESSIDKITDRVKSYIVGKDGKITYEENWGKKKLAYEIKKSEVGIYILVYFELPKDALTKIERELRLSEEIIRFMVLSKEEKIKTAKRRTRPPKEETKSVTTKEEKPKIAEKTEEKEVKKAEPKTEKRVKKPISLGQDGKVPEKKKIEKEEVTEETEEERMKKLDEKLGAILGDEEK